ncbi:uncharacterized protein N7498_004513 [Penicillium cinerascens]|uniref:Major facilitator superfamily (MFS) profile domain-containing protein n=1 Tax=Penicillium cinerascens TaxID=70096 RepID=A0A9W9MLW3_9EURO|nr:uncharacterized protein N7498_004513 [Penicillium cinerascens]KAJ5203634.1 hypothetical protein N7498_004513 [Penicillium cinerascens]
MADSKMPDLVASSGHGGIPRDPLFEVTWHVADKENPRTWPVWYKSFIVAAMSFSTTIVVVYTTMYTSGVDGIQKEFDVSSKIIVLLGLTTNLFGLAFGSVVLSSLSEIYGRRPIYLISVFLFGVLILPVALANSIEAILISRFFGGFFGGTMISSAPGSVTDVTDDQYRALALSCWSLGTMNGPVLGPIIGGFVYQYLGWRWINWLVLICSGVSLVLMSLVKETYAPALLRKRTKKLQKETGDQRWWCRFDHEETGFQVLRTNLVRPFRMIVFEPICVFWDLYVSVVYSVLFLCFVAYPIVFEDLRGWAPGLAGLSYCGIGTGTAIAVTLEPLIRRFIAMHPRDPITGRPAPEAAVFAVCMGSILIPIGEFWFAWTARPPIHWVCPILAGLPFGLGNGLVFIYATNYMAGSYTVYAASALAGNSIVRYGLAGVLPLAGSKIYSTLGANWAGTMLALIEVILIPIPFVFYKYGHKIRLQSPMIVKGLENGTN